MVSFKNGFFASPFNSTDDEIDPTTEEGKEVLSQPPATKWELWGYYLYYNGVCMHILLS
jgi:hypothetical protein